MCATAVTCKKPEAPVVQGSSERRENREAGSQGADVNAL